MFFDEFLELSRELQKHHSIFHKFWKMGNPVYSSKIERAAVEFDKIGDCVNFYINKKFWDTLDSEKKQFVIAHECLHVLLYHGIRSSLLKDQQSRQLANIAMDLVVNHTLEDNFGFNRANIDPKNEYCWVDTVFENQKIPSGKSFEYYFHLLQKNPPPMGGSGGKNKQEGQGDQKQPGGGGKQKGEQGDQQGQGGSQLVDDHEFLESFNDKNFEEQMQEAIDNFDASDRMAEIVDEHNQDLKEAGKQAGLNPGSMMKVAKTPPRIFKKKWETVIKNWTKKFAFDKEEEQWVRKNRRMAAMAPSGLMLPTDAEIEHEEKHKIGVWFFQDTSGSCAHLADRFFAAAATLDPDRFDVVMHCFDTRVYETDLKSKKLYGFGGTSFTCIEQYIQAKVKQGKRYPSAVFIITDGYGDNVNPEHPTKWYWFLSENYKQCIPATCNTYMLKDYE
jgi:hypothetical protein